jgi:hypothetical protein
MVQSPILAQRQSAMSIWINKSFVILALVGLTACQGFDFVPQSHKIAILDGAVTVAPPKGYCVDAESSRTGNESAVILMGRCSATSTLAAALVTASLGAAGSDAALSIGPVALTSFFNSDEGLAILSSSGKPEDVAVTTSQIDGETLFLLIEDKASGTYWRAFSSLQGRLLTLTAAGVDTVVLNPDDGRALLAQTLVALNKANPKPRVPKAG